MNTVKMIFLKKECELEMYNNIVNMLLKKGFKPLNNTVYKYTFSCRNTTTSNYPFNETNKLKPYSYTITIKQYKLAA